MAGKKGKKNGRRKQKIPIFATAGILVGLKELWDAYKAGGSKHVILRLTGFHQDIGEWNWKWATAGIPMVIGPVASMVMSKVGVNRYVKIPWFKL